MSKPRLSILSPDFKYRNSSQTNVADTFKRIRREQKEQAEKITQEQKDKVITIGHVPATIIRGKVKP